MMNSLIVATNENSPTTPMPPCVDPYSLELNAASYGAFKTRAEQEVQTLYKQYADAYASGQNFVNLTLVSDLGKP